jgi:DNA-binding MarR family transcriptional regulator
MTAQLAHDLRIVLGAYRRRMRVEGYVSDFTPSQIGVLARLETGPASVTELADAEGVRTQSMGATVAGLEAAGFIRRDPHPTDGRRTLLSLTDAARERFSADRAGREDWLLRNLVAALDAEEREQLAASIPLLQRVVESRPEQPR